MSKEEYNKSALITTEDERLAYKKKSKTSSKSNSGKRSDHKHNYEQIIIEHGNRRPEYYWAKRCKICGRVDDGDRFKDISKKGLIKKKKIIKLQSGTSYSFEIFYSFIELKQLFPNTSIIRNIDYKKGEYEEVKG